ncbi:hypothetical protein Tco_0205220 [Tanacetum coccineum]
MLDGGSDVPKGGENETISLHHQNWWDKSRDDWYGPMVAGSVGHREPVLLDNEAGSGSRFDTAYWEAQYGVLDDLAWAPRIKYSRIFLSWYGYDVSDILDTVYQTYWVRCIGLLRYGVLAHWVRHIGSLGTVFCTSWVRCSVHLGYRVLAESVLFLIFDQCIIYDVYTDVDTVYSSKSGNGLLIRQSLGDVV